MTITKVPATTDYALRVLIRLANDQDSVVTAQAVAEQLGLSPGFLEQVLRSLRQAGILASRRGGHGGYRLAVLADELSVADVVHAVQQVSAPGSSERDMKRDAEEPTETLDALWLAFWVNAQEFLEAITIADLAAGQLPAWAVQLAQRAGKYRAAPISSRSSSTKLLAERTPSRR